MEQLDNLLSPFFDTNVK